MKLQSKSTAIKTVSAVLILLTVFSFASCKKEKAQDAGLPSSLWDGATYTEDTVLGQGKNTVTVEVKAEEKSVTFTIKSDETNLGNALIESSLIEGDYGEYGLYIKKVNGIVADYDINKAYWGFYKNGEMMTTGANGVEFKSGEHYELVYEK